MLHVNVEVADRAVNLGVTEQDLNGPKIDDAFVCRGRTDPLDRRLWRRRRDVTPGKGIDAGEFGR